MKCMCIQEQNVRKQSKRKMHRYEGIWAYQRTLSNDKRTTRTGRHVDWNKINVTPRMQKNVQNQPAGINESILGERVAICY